MSADYDMFQLLKLADVSTLLAVGDGKFRSVRTVDYRIPIIELPCATYLRTIRFGDKEYIELLVEDAGDWSRVDEWVHRLDETKTVHKVVRCDGGENIVRVRLFENNPPLFGLNRISLLGTPDADIKPGCKLRCVVEISCVWTSGECIGVSFNFVQALVLCGGQHECLIVDDENVL